MPGRLEDIPWIPLPGPCCCEGRWTDARSYAYGPNGDGSIEGPDMAVLLEVIREGKVAAAREIYFPGSQTPAPPAVTSTVLPDQQAQLLQFVEQQNVGASLVSPGVAVSQTPIQQQPHAPAGTQQHLPDLNQIIQGRRPSWSPGHQPFQPYIRGQRQEGQSSVPWPSTLVSQARRGYPVYQGSSQPASSTGRAGHPMPAPARQPLPSADDSMAWYNSNVFPLIQPASARSRPNQRARPGRQQPAPARQQPYPARYRPAPARQPPRLGSPIATVGPNVPPSQRQPYPQPLGIDPFPAQNYFDLINQTEQRNMRSGPSAYVAPQPSTYTASTSTSTAGLTTSTTRPFTSTAGPSTFVPDPLTPAFVSQTSADAEGSNVATTASEQPVTSGDWTRNLGHYVQPQFRNQGTGTPYIQPQWKRQPGAWTRGE